MPTLETPNSGTGVNIPPTASQGDAATREKAKDAQTYDVEDCKSENEPDKEAPEGAAKMESPLVAYLEQMFSKRLDAMQSMVERLPGVAPPIRKSKPDSYADTPYADEITFIEMPRRFSFPSIKAYDGTSDPDDHVAQYRQRMLAVALPKESHEATMCKGFGSTLTGPALQWYINLPTRSIASFAILSDKFVEQFASSRDLEKTSDGLYEILQHRAEARFNQEKVSIPECNIPTAISAFKRGQLPDGDLYKELTKYQCKTIYQNRPIEKAEWMAVSTWPNIYHLSVSRRELIKVLRRMGQQVKWPQQMKTPDSFRNPGLWCDFHQDHCHKTEDCVALKIEVNEFLKKGHLRELLSEKARRHLSKETTGKPTEAAPVSPPRQDRNSQTDSLANLGSTLERDSQMSIPLLVLQWPATLEEPRSEEVSAIKEENLKSISSANHTKKREVRIHLKGAHTYDVENSESEPEPDKEAPEGAAKMESPLVAYLEQMFSKRLDTMQSMVERLPGVALPIRKSNSDSYADTPFTDEITLIEMPRKFPFLIIKAYDGTSDPDAHVGQYRQRMLAIALPKESREATMCKWFGSTLTGPALQWYINLPSRSIASFVILSDMFLEQFASSKDLEKTYDGLYEILQHRAEPLQGYIARFNQEKVAIPECSIPTAIYAFKRGLLPDGDLYKELTKYQCKTMEDVMSRAWAHVKWEENVASRAKAQLKQDPKAVRPDRTERDEKPSPRSARDPGNRNRGRYQNRPIEKAEGMAVFTWPDISHISASRSELINVLRQMGQQVKWPQKMKAPDSFRNPGLWCDFHREHGHKTEDCVALKIEVNELLKQGHLREFLSEKAKSHISKETTGKPTEAAPVSPPLQDRVIHVISSGSEISDYLEGKDQGLIAIIEQTSGSSH
ncbi:hypothetical protein DY000_02007165 [Brassica cretica]|uniref:Retrotransposon gag domain-containing protein n=1 Tax=Brassica cretica TaxID=69181 RepID=A0ABQ7C183_BRACR|nr:hypothetical protein DY000_02007165 [Brassica cretica]